MTYVPAHQLSSSHYHSRSLLTKISYNPPSDVLISAGDIVAKGPLNGSLDVLSYMASNNVIAVRGNHDQKVIEWRTWIKWIHTLPSGKRWLRQTYSRFLEDLLALPGDEELDVDEWLENERKKDRKRNSKNKKWWNRIPEGWQLFGDHYRIADKMSEEEYEYMVSRPLKIHVPHAHVYIAHAGVLASNPKLKPYHKDQPLAKIPDLPKTDAEELKKDKGDKKKELLRKLQEIAVLKEVPQNRDPWVTLNMRGVLNDEVTRWALITFVSSLYYHNLTRVRLQSERWDALVGSLQTRHESLRRLRPKHSFHQPPQRCASLQSYHRFVDAYQCSEPLYLNSFYHSHLRARCIKRPRHQALVNRSRFRMRACLSRLR